MRTNRIFARLAAMRILIAAIFVVLTFAASACSQTAIDPEKRELIHQFAFLTKMNEPTVNAVFSADVLKKRFSDMIDNDKNLPEAQKVILRKWADDAVQRVGLKWKAQFESDPKFQELGIQSAIEVYDKAFTSAELKDLIAFYASPLGQKTVAFLGSVKSDIEKAFVDKTRTRMEGIVDPLINVEADALCKMIKDAEKSGK